MSGVQSCSFFFFLVVTCFVEIVKIVTIRSNNYNGRSTLLC